MNISTSDMNNIHKLQHPIDIHILMYHHIAPRGEADDLRPFVVFKENFQQQLLFLKKSGFRSLHLGEVFDEAEGNLSIPGRKVVITFDDGSMNLFEHAFPLLKEYGFTATFFIISGMLSMKNNWDIPQMPRVSLMGKDEIRELVKEGFEIGSHGVTHINLSKCSESQALAELTDSRKQIQDMFGVPSDFHAYPFAEYPKNYSELCSKAGYRGAVGITSPARYAVDDQYAVRRVLVHTGDNILRFRLKMTRLFLRFLSVRERR